MIAAYPGVPVEAEHRPPARLDPNQRIEQMTGRRHLSWSQLTSFRGCPRRWHFSHVEQQAPAFVPASLIFGSAFHAAVQRFFEGRMAGGDPGVEELFGEFETTWQNESEHAALPVRFGSTEDELSLHARAASMLDAFRQSELARLPGHQIVGVEETFSGSIHPDLPDLMGRLDLIWIDNDGLHLVDIKTARSRWTAEHADEAGEQLRLYARLARDLLPGERVHLHFAVVTKTKSPVVQPLSVPAEADEGRLADLALPVWKAMAAGVDFTNPNPMNCSGCGYRSICPAHSRK